MCLFVYLLPVVKVISAYHTCEIITSLPRQHWPVSDTTECLVSISHKYKEFTHTIIVVIYLRCCLTPVLTPAGWDVEKGNVRGDGLNPDLLISLSAPKLCAQHFKGRHHYLGLRIIPKELADKYRIKLPTYPSTDQIVKLKWLSWQTACTCVCVDLCVDLRLSRLF